DELSEEDVNGTLVAAIRRQWGASSDAHLAEDLQEARMKSILGWLTATLIGLIIVVPLVVGLQVPAKLAKAPAAGQSPPTFIWPLFGTHDTVLQSYIAVLAIALIGCVGGTLSALLSARDSKVRLLTYRTE